MDFANMVFSMSHGGINFAALLPKAYARERCGILTHHLIRENGRIRALTDAYPLMLRQTDGELRAAYIGTVAVHPDSRGRGWMSALMAAAEADARERQCDLLILDGRRHRYRHYGFEQAGMRCSFAVCFEDIREACGALQEGSGGACAYRFVLVEPDLEGFEELLDGMYGLYARRSVTARTRADFYRCLQSMAADTYAVLEGETLCGYLNVSEDERELFELELADDTRLAEVLCDFMRELDISELIVETGADETAKTECLDSLCGNSRIGMSHQIKILNYPRVLSFLLKWKQKYSAPEDGEFVIGVTDGQASGKYRQYKLCVAGAAVTVCETDAPADVVFEGMELVRALTTNYYYHMAQDPYSPLKNAPAGWFPLPFYLPNADTF
ncbi:MAG: GNAT family N-acetyltransferase [Roseburia sp.]|nr:GNAT family N-acetyltransferase [Roseburia sp.]